MTPDPRASLPAWRRGWTFTLLKCALLTAVTAALGAGALWWLLHAFQPPWFVPRPVFEWLLTHLRPYALGVGAIAGSLVGALGSVGVVVWDARRGRLSRLK